MRPERALRVLRGPLVSQPRLRSRQPPVSQEQKGRRKLALPASVHCQKANSAI